MAPKVTSSSNRNRRGSAKPVTKGQNPQRSNRQAVSTAQITSGSNGKPSGGGARVTNASQRTSNGSARVTGTPRAALPPGTPRPVRASIGNVSGPASTPKAPGTNANLRPSGSPRTAPSVPRPAAGTRASAAPKPAAPAARPNPGAGRLIGRGGAATMGLGLVSAVQDKFLSKEQLDKKYENEKGKVYNEVRQNLFGKDKPVSKDSNNRSSRGIRVSDKGNKRDYQSAPTGSQEYNDFRRNQIEAEKQRLKGVGNAPARATSSGGSGSRSSAPARMPSSVTRSSSPKASAPTPPSERRVSASTANRESGNYGTSKTNNPLMKDLVGRMKDREDRDQASKASKLTSNFGKDSGYQPKDKVDGSGVDTKKKMGSTSNEYNSKKRRYGS